MVKNTGAGIIIIDEQMSVAKRGMVLTETLNWASCVVAPSMYLFRSIDVVGIKLPNKFS